MTKRASGPFSFDEVFLTICRHMKSDLINDLDSMEVPDGEKLLGRIISGEKVPEDEISSLWDHIQESIRNDAECVESIPGMTEDSWDENNVFNIEIMKYGPVFFVRVPEFGDSPYYLTLQSAWQYAQDNFEPHITAFEKWTEQGE